MKNKKNIFAFFIGIILIIFLFSISFYFTFNKLSARKDKNNPDIAVQTVPTEFIKPNAKINLYIKDKNGQSTKVESVEFKVVMDKLEGDYDLKALQTYYQGLGYYYRELDEDGYAFEKRFVPNRYYISVCKDEKNKEVLAIFRSDEEGKLEIEDEKSDITQTSINKIPKEQERELYRKGFGGVDDKGNVVNEGFKTKEEAFEALSAIIS